MYYLSIYERVEKERGKLIPIYLSIYLVLQTMNKPIDRKREQYGRIYYHHYYSASYLSV